MVWEEMEGGGVRWVQAGVRVVARPEGGKEGWAPGVARVEARGLWIRQVERVVMVGGGGQLTMAGARAMLLRKGVTGARVVARPEMKLD